MAMSMLRLYKASLLVIYDRLNDEVRMATRGLERYNIPAGIIFMLKPAQYHPAITFVAVILSFHPNLSFLGLLLFTQIYYDSGNYLTPSSRLA